MTLVQNRLLPLNGSKWLIIGCIGLFMAACSPKIRQATGPVKPVDTAKKPATQVKPAISQGASVTQISLLLPFYLDQLNLYKGADPANLNRADLALEYYQGFKLAIDSLAARGLNFRLQVYDTKDEAVQSRVLAVNPKVRTSNIIVGPVYPEGIKGFSTGFGELKKMIVSPLSPSPPTDYKCPNLVTMMPPLEYHTHKAAAYINDQLKAKKVFVLRSGFSDENKYILPFKRAIDSLSKHHIKIIIIVLQHGNLGTLMSQLSKTEPNVFVVPSTDQQFLQVTLHSLDTLARKYPVAVFGHPNWEKATFLHADLLQRINTYITSTDKIDYHAANVIRFVKAYRKAYHAEPGEFAIKGYDEGSYLGALSAADAAAFKLPDFNGLHNNFHFVNVNGMGWVNTYVKLLKYTNFDLKPAE
jgi:ABC-type branched-subunit amino acid transport system substrate-binding protein